MATALDVVRRAMRLIGALAEGEVPTAEQLTDGLTAMQGMLGDWETRGVFLGGAVDTTYAGATEVPVPVTHLNALAFNLAVSLAPEYGRQDALQAVLPQAERSFLALQAQYANVPICNVDPALVDQDVLLTVSMTGEGIGGGDDGALAGDAGALYP